MPPVGQIVTFYSYKGGVGRSMALANTAALLAQWRYKVLAVDWDLEAPGLEKFFASYVDLSGINDQTGIVDLLLSAHSSAAGGTSPPLSWEDLLVPVCLPESKGALHLLTAGKRDADYFRRVRSFDIHDFYLEKQGGSFVEELRSQWSDRYDVVLIDSRTGVTDIGGICTIQLPDILVLLFTPTDQSLQGTLDVARKSVLARQKLPMDRLKLLTLPIASRFDDREFELAQSWLDRASDELSSLYADWLPRSVRRITLLEQTKLPYKAYFSFGEKLAAIEESRGAPGSLAYAYATLAALLVHKLEHTELLEEQRDDYVRRARQPSSHADAEPTFLLSGSALSRHRQWFDARTGEGRIDLIEADLRDARLPEAFLAEARIVDSELSGADLTRARLTGADLSGSKLQGALLEKADLRKARLDGARLFEAHLEGANLSRAELKSVFLQDANLSGADLREANLDGAEMRRANLSGALLRGATLRSIDLGTVRGLTPDQLAATDLTGASLPNELVNRERQLRVKKLGKRAFAFAVLIGVALLLVAWMVIATTDAELVVNDWSYLGVGNFGVLVSVRTRIGLTAVFLLLFYVAGLAYLRRLWDELAHLPAVSSEDGQDIASRLPYGVAGFVRAHFPLLLGGRSPSPDRLVYAALTWCSVPVALLLLWAEYLFLRDQMGTLLLLSALYVALASGMFFRRDAVVTLRHGSGASAQPAALPSDDDLPPRWSWLSKPKPRTFALLLGAALLLLVLSQGAEATPPGGYNPGLSANEYTFRTTLFRALKLLGMSPVADLRGARLSGQSFGYRENLRYALADGVDMTRAGLSTADLLGARLRKADLREASLDRVLLDGADLRQSRLSLASLKEASLQNANLEESDLSEADLTDADLWRASLARANLRGAVLQGANLRGADLSGVIHLTPEQLSAALIDETTRLPESLRKILQELNVPG